MPRHALRFILVLLAALSLTRPGQCPGAPAHDGARLLIQPEAVELRGAGAEHGLLVTLVEPDGQTQDVTAKCHFTSTAAQQIDVSAVGRCRAEADGRAEVVAEYEGLSARVAVTAVDAAKVKPPSFRQDVVPVLTRTGCNAGSCHGKLAGQNGFKLSLRGYAPEADFESLTADLDGRRIDFAEPARSLLLRKPLGQVPHEGGRRFAEGSAAERVLSEWVKARAPGPDPAESDAASLEILPGDRVLRVGQTQQLLVRALYPDGRVRDVTGLAQFYANDPAVLSVSEAGVVRSLRPGESSVRAHFQGLVAVVTCTTPYDNSGVDPSLFAQSNNVVDEHVFARLRSLRLPPSPPCDDATFARRAYLDVIGTLPEPREVRAFLADARADKRARLVEELLARPEFNDYWAMLLGDLFQNRRERDHDVRGAKGVRAMHGWLREQVAANRPWDQTVRDVLTASGDAVGKPQIGYFVVTLGEKQNAEESDVADSAAQAFLGTRVGCARCHNHPLEKYTQDDYYHFAAFFSRVTLKRVEVGKGTTSLLACGREEAELRKQLAESDKSLAAEREAAEVAFEGEGDPETQAKAAKAKASLRDLEKRQDDLRSQIAKAAEKPPGVSQPRTGQFMNPRALDRSDPHLRPGQDPREALADWMTAPSNPYFSGAMVNRLWKHFMGVGLVEPVDDLRSSNPPSNAPLWDALGREFVSHQFDLKHVMRLILNSRAYQLDSATLPQNEPDRRFYSHYFARRLTAEVMLDAVGSATGVPDEFPGYPVGLRAIDLPDPGVNSYFLTLFGRPDRVTACSCERNDEVTLPQLLHLGNGDATLRKVPAADGRLAQILADGSDDHRVTEELFLATFSRLPSESEQAAVTKALAGGDARQDVFRDLFWALLNSKEFAFNH